MPKKHPITLKAERAKKHVNNPNAEVAPRPAEWLATTENGIRGQHTVERGDGKQIEFKSGQYMTNDAAEASFLAAQDGIKVEHRAAKSKRTRRVYSMGIAFGKDGKVLEEA